MSTATKLLRRAQEFLKYPLLHVSDNLIWPRQDLFQDIENFLAAEPEAEPLIWLDGSPPKPYGNEWFIAETTYGDRVVLKTLPDDYSYDYKTADETYIKADKIRRWMQFPDSNYCSPRPEPARKPMTEEELENVFRECHGNFEKVARAIEKHHGIGGDNE